jgi:hypothetical protein
MGQPRRTRSDRVEMKHPEGDGKSDTEEMAEGSIATEPLSSFFADASGIVAAVVDEGWSKTFPRMLNNSRVTTH